MRPFLVCIHDATPAFARETAAMIRDLAPLLGRSLSFGVVPDWHARWPLAAHPDYCAMLREASGELLLHGYFHERQRGWGAATWLAERSDEMNGLDPAETRSTIERGQRVFTEVFGAPARGFVAPAWQRRHVGASSGSTEGPEYILGFFSLTSAAGVDVPLATSTWDCGRWGWLGYVGHGIGALLQSQHHRTPVLALHPRDLERGFWPAILRLTRTLLDRGYEPSTPGAVLDLRGTARDAEVPI